jgi:hypothetical protein
MTTVSGNYYGRLITNGLVLMLDAIKRDSYPRLGTQWYDISRNNNNCSLINGPSFTNKNGGDIVFDGIDDYATINDSNSLNFGTGDFTVILWINGVTSYPGETKTIIWKGSRFDQNIAGWSLVWAGVPQELYLIVSDDVSRNEHLISGFGQGWDGYKMIGFKRQNGVLYFINDGVVTNLVVTNNKNVNNSYPLFIAKSGVYNGSNLSCSIPKILIYNRALSDSEILLNNNTLIDKYNNIWKDNYIWIDTNIWQNKIT